MINSRDMRILLIFDLPTMEAYERKEYRVFRTQLVKHGYTMIQFSVYMKNFNKQITLREEVEKLHKYIPRSGSIRAISLTEHQWQNMEYVLGEKMFDEYLNDNERFKKI